MEHTIRICKSDTGEWVLDILANPFGGPNDKDADGEWFSQNTKFYEDRLPLPPAVYYHGYDDDGPLGEPEFLGPTIKRWVDDDGVWYRTILDKASEFAKKVWEAAKRGAARVSSGVVPATHRVAPTGEITNWMNGEVSIFEIDSGKRPANMHAVALPAMKAVYQQAGIALPDMPEPEAEARGESEEPQAAKATVTKSKDIGEEEMEKKEIEGLVTDTVAATVAKALADHEAQKAAQADAEKAQREAIEKAKAEAVEAAKAEWAKGNRLPEYNGKAPAVIDSDHFKYDNMEVIDHAFMVSMLNDAKAAGHSRNGASVAAHKSLAKKMEANEDKKSGRGLSAMKARGIKSDELNYSTLASYGNDWAGVEWSNRAWDKIRLGTPVVGRIPTIEVPQGYESITIPVVGASPTFYKVAQAADMAANPGATTPTVTVSQLGTTSQSLSVGKLGAATTFTGELEEDSIVPWAAMMRQDLIAEGQEVLESLMIDGDTATSATTNINDIAGTPAGTEYWQVLNGFRKLALVTNTANSRSAAGSLNPEQFLETLKLMGLAGKNAADKSKVSFIIDMWTNWKALEMEEVKTKDVKSNPTLESGLLSRIWGYEVIPTGNMHRPSADTTYGLKANSAGKIDQDTASNNAYGAILAVRWDQWLMGIKRSMKMEFQRVPRADATEVTALMRVGLVYRDTDASAISYYTGV